MGVEVATEWLFSLPPHVLAQHLAERDGSGAATAGGHDGGGGSGTQSGHEVKVALEPRRVPLTVGVQGREGRGYAWQWEWGVCGAQAGWPLLWS